MSIKDLVHERIVKASPKLCEWFKHKETGLIVPIYSSFDIRDSGQKVSTVDANIFPAGFNNICEVDRESAVEVAKRYFERVYGKNLKRILLLTEEHTNNPYYWENINALKKIFTSAGKEVCIAVPRDFSTPLKVKSANGTEIAVHSARRSGVGIDVEGFIPELVVSNNDFSDAYSEWSNGLQTPINPPREMGWYRRKKSDFFREYNTVVDEFCQLLNLDPWHMRVETELFAEFDMADEKATDRLAKSVDEMLVKIKNKYLEHGIKEEPFVFVKNNAGTYGLGVIQVNSGEEIRTLNYKSRKKMKAAKGGRDVTEVIVQEGISTIYSNEQGSAEPAIYLIGCELAGGFLRTHGEKGPHDSLNSPGAVYKRLCVSDLEIDMAGKPMENVYGWVAKLGLLAIGREFKSYQGS